MISPSYLGYSAETLAAFASLPVLLLLVTTGLWLGCCHQVVLDRSIGMLLGGFLLGSSGLCSALRGLGGSSALLALIGGGAIIIGRTNSVLLRCGYFLACGYVLGLSVPVQIEWTHVVLCGALVVFLPVAIGFYLSLLPDRPVWFLARRVMGSWIVAVSLLFFAFSIKHGQTDVDRLSAQETWDRLEVGQG